MQVLSVSIVYARRYIDTFHYLDCSVQRRKQGSRATDIYGSVVIRHIVHPLGEATKSQHLPICEGSSTRNMEEYEYIQTAQTFDWISNL
jgi:hypothetical protein